MFKKFITLTAVLAATGAMWVLAKDQDKTIDIFNYTFSPLKMEVISETGNLVFSDSPEYVGKQDGIVSASTVQGDSRIYFYHVNEAKQNRKIVIVFENKSVKDNYITVKRKIVAKPTAEYFEVGRELSAKELTVPVAGNEVIVMSPGARLQVFNELEKITVKTDQLFSGIMDFHSTEPVFVRVMMIDENAPAIGRSYTAPALPMDEVRLRGTYVGANRLINIVDAYDPKRGSAVIELANDREDPYIKGFDELTNNEEVKNYGNYGVAYTILLNTLGEQKYDVYFNPLGGAYAGAIQLTNNAQSKLIEIPKRSQPYIGHGTITDTQFLQTYQAGTPLQINFMPAGASNLPVRLLLIPHIEEATDDLKTQVAQKAENIKTNVKKKVKKTKNHLDEVVEVAKQFKNDKKAKEIQSVKEAPKSNDGPLATEASAALATNDAFAHIEAQYKATHGGNPS